MYMSEVMKSDAIGECIWCQSAILAGEHHWVFKNKSLSCDRCMQIITGKKIIGLSKLRKKADRKI